MPGYIATLAADCKPADIITASELPAFCETWFDLSVVATDKRSDAKKWLLTDCEICLRRQLALKGNECLFKQHLSSPERFDIREVHHRHLFIHTALSN